MCVVDDAGKLIDTLSLAELVRAEGPQKVSELVDDFTPAVGTEADVPEVARLMSDYNLIAMPVLDADGRPVGIIAVDDVLELLVPGGVAVASGRGAGLTTSRLAGAPAHEPLADRDRALDRVPVERVGHVVRPVVVHRELRLIDDASVATA